LAAVFILALILPKAIFVLAQHQASLTVLNVGLMTFSHLGKLNLFQYAR